MDRLLVLSVFVVASCGIAYELVAAALASYLLGDSVLQFSSIIGCYLFAMGCGAALSRHVPDGQLLRRFVDIELAVGLFGASRPPCSSVPSPGWPRRSGSCCMRWSS